MPIHAGSKASGAVFEKCIGCHCEDGRRGMVRQRADQARGFQPVHLRHLHVHQDQVEALARGELDGLNTGVGHLDLQPDQFQQFDRNFLVDRVVFGQQKACRRAPQSQG